MFIINMVSGKIIAQMKVRNLGNYPYEFKISNSGRYLALIYNKFLKIFNVSRG